jgi:hypothetical protein
LVALGAACNPSETDACVPAGHCAPLNLGMSLQDPQTAPTACLPEHYPLLCYARAR